MEAFLRYFAEWNRRNFVAYSMIVAVPLGGVGVGTGAVIGFQHSVIFAIIYAIVIGGVAVFVVSPAIVAILWLIDNYLIDSRR